MPWSEWLPRMWSFRAKTRSLWQAESCHLCLKAWMPAPVQMFLLYWFAIPFFYIEWVGPDQRLYNVWSEAKCSPCVKFVWATPWCTKKSMSFFICILVFIYLFIWSLSWKARRCGNKGSLCVPSGLEHNLLTGYGQNVLSYLFALTAQLLWALAYIASGLDNWLAINLQ